MSKKFIFFLSKFHPFLLTLHSLSSQISTAIATKQTVSNFVFMEVSSFGQGWFNDAVWEGTNLRDYII